MRKICKAVTGFYILACVAALVVIPLNAAGMAGEPDPMSGVFALLLALPWLWFTEALTSDRGVAWNMAVAAGCMALNALILRVLCSWLARKTGSSGS